ncbi:MAG TPA: UDP-N-acetylmuramate dehydrogenase [Candidatus Paceibacterota bacterium]|nr:UDP-N-acetylmuramate dehydrogenase [Candidatus Paceibacterota bacterium]
MQEIKENIPLAPLTTFQIGGAAKYFVEARTNEDIQEAVEYAQKRDIRFVILSGGSNVLIPDEGLNALVIHIVSDAHAFSDNVLHAEAGCNLLELIKEASEKDLGGWEKLAGIPGSIGGAVRGNAGAFGSEIKDFVTSVQAFNVDTKQSRGFVQPYMNFAYRDSFFKHHPEWVITSVTLELQQSPYEKSAALIAETIAEREKRHLQNVRAAGSFFMNPVASAEIVALFEREKNVQSRESRVPAGWLIEKVGMKGACVGGACASEQHPNYLVNVNSATATDVLALAANIKKAVSDAYGIRLQEEAALFPSLTE